MSLKLTQILMVLVFVISNIEAKCPYSFDAWKKTSHKEKQKLITQYDLSLLSDSCFINLLQISIEYKKEFVALKFLTNYCNKKHSFSRSLLLQIVDLDTVFSGLDILKLWEQFNGSYMVALHKLEERGFISEADSLFLAMDIIGVLEGHDLLKWANIQSILGQYGNMAELYCRAASEKKKLLYLAQQKLASLLREIDLTQDKRIILNRYRDCMLVQKNIDTTSIGRWLKSMYAVYDLHKEKIKAIEHFEVRPIRKGISLLSEARISFQKRRFQETIEVARKAWPFLENNKDIKRCAALLYHAYKKIGRSDSALVWLDKTGIHKNIAISGAITLYQSLGLIDEADSALAVMTHTIDRDTLYIRQAILTNDTNMQLESLRPLLQPRWEKYKNRAHFWRSRLFLFTNATASFSCELDSISFLSSSKDPYYDEMVAMRIARELLKNEPHALGVWGTIMRENYLLNDDFKIIKPHSSWSEKACGFIVCEQIDILLQKNRIVATDTLLNILNRFKMVTPRVIYLSCVVLNKKGEHKNARRLFEKLILENPKSVFAHKARIYLLAMDKRITM